jgi:hypothetical protein
MEKIIKIILIFVLLYILYSWPSYEHMKPLSAYIDESVDDFKDEILHHDVCQIQQPQLGKGRPYVNWQKIHDYGKDVLGRDGETVHC